VVEGDAPAPTPRPRDASALDHKPRPAPAGRRPAAGSRARVEAATRFGSPPAEQPDGAVRVRRDAERPVGDTCEIRWWRGFAGSEFIAVARAADDERLVASSPVLRWRGDKPPPPGAASRAAHRALVAELNDSGWEPAGQGAGWYETRFRRRQADACTDV
jgi:hypothetical protein